MTILFLDVLKDGWINFLFGNALLAGVVLLMAVALLLLKARVPAHMILLILLPVVIAYSTTSGIFATYLYGVWVIIAGLILGLIYMGVFRDQ